MINSWNNKEETSWQTAGYNLQHLLLFYFFEGKLKLNLTSSTMPEVLSFQQKCIKESSLWWRYRRPFRLSAVTVVPLKCILPALNSTKFFEDDESPPTFPKSGLIFLTKLELEVLLCGKRLVCKWPPFGIDSLLRPRLQTRKTSPLISGLHKYFKGWCNPTYKILLDLKVFISKNKIFPFANSNSNIFFREGSVFMYMFCFYKITFEGSFGSANLKHHLSRTNLQGALCSLLMTSFDCFKFFGIMQHHTIRQKKYLTVDTHTIKTPSL